MLDNTGCTFSFEIPEEELFAMLDREQMDRVFYNLAENATQYNPNGTEITVNLYETADHIIIDFADNGVGIPPELSARIFDPFIRADNAINLRPGGSPTGSPTGTGLGLAIVAKIIGLHGGKIQLHTSLSEGCRFEIVLPKI
jgi:signal transduction histidine kinase